MHGFVRPVNLSLSSESLVNSLMQVTILNWGHPIREVRNLLGFRKSTQDLAQSTMQYAAKHAIATPGIQRRDLPKDSIRKLDPAAPSIVAFRNAISKQTCVVARRAMVCERSGGGKENNKPTVARQVMD